MYNQDIKNANSDKVKSCKICEKIKPIGAFYNYAYVTTNVCKACKLAHAEAPPENKTPSVIIPCEIDNANTAKTWQQAIAFWGFKINPEKDMLGNGKCIVSMGANWKMSHSAFSGVSILYDSLKRARARFRLSDILPLLEVLPAVSFQVDFDVHLDGKFSAEPFYLRGDVKFKGSTVWQTPTTPAPIRNGSDGCETAASREYRQKVRTELTHQCQMYIKNNYPQAEKDAFAYWL
jgi:hypothetical protein